MQNAKKMTPANKISGLKKNNAFFILLSIFLFSINNHYTSKMKSSAYAFCRLRMGRAGTPATTV